MTLTSPTKHIDLKVYTHIASIVHICHRMQRNDPDPCIQSFLEQFASKAQKWAKYVKSHDYTKDDQLYWRVQDRLAVDNSS